MRRPRLRLWASLSSSRLKFDISTGFAWLCRQMVVLCVRSAVFQLSGDGEFVEFENWGDCGYRCEGCRAFGGVVSIFIGMFSGVVLVVSILKMSRASS